MFKPLLGLLHQRKLAINEEMAHTVGAIFPPVRCQIALIVEGYDEMEVRNKFNIKYLNFKSKHLNVFASVALIVL